MAILLMGCTGAAGIAWQHKPLHSNRTHFQQDTIPQKEKEDKTIISGDIDKTIEEINRAKENIEKQLQNKDWEKWHRDLEQSLEKLNTENVQQQVAKAMKEIDFQKMQWEAQAALQKIDQGKMQKDIEKAQAELKNSIGSMKIEMDIRRSLEETKKAMNQLKAADMEKVQLEVEKATEELKLQESVLKENLDRARESINRNLKKDFKEELEKAREGIERAEKELHNYKDMLDEMDKDGLIHSNESYNIEYKKGELYINGTKQTETVTSKYKHYFKKENVKLTMGKEDGKRTIHL